MTHFLYRENFDYLWKADVNHNQNVSFFLCNIKFGEQW